MPKFYPCDFDLGLKVCVRFRNVFITSIPIKLHLLYLAHTCLGTRPFHACQNGYHIDIGLDLRVHVQVSKSAFWFQESFITPIPIDPYLLYFTHTCIWTRPFHAHQKFNPYDIDLDVDFRPLPPGEIRCLLATLVVNSKYHIEIHLYLLMHGHKIISILPTCHSCLEILLQMGCGQFSVG